MSEPDKRCFFKDDCGKLHAAFFYGDEALAAFKALKSRAESHLSEHPADEEEPITIDWLNGLARSDGGDLSMMRVRICEDRSIRLMSPCAKVHEGIEGMDGYIAPRHATRGDVRRLCSALGIELTEAQSEC